MVLKFVVCLAIVAASLKNAEALTQEEMTAIYEKFLPHISECSKEHDLSEGDLKQAKEDGNIDAVNSCFFACVLKKGGFINEEGMFDSDKALEKTKEIFKSDEDIKKATAIIEECSAVNSEDVSDGKAGCDRSKLLVACMAKHKSELPL